MVQPSFAPIACASSIAAEQKSRTWRSSSMRSPVAPVIADTGFIVMLPQSLYQTSCRIFGVEVTSKPALLRSSCTVLRRDESEPSGSPMIRPMPFRCSTTPGASVEAAR